MPLAPPEAGPGAGMAPGMPVVIDLLDAERDGFR
jgi:hypothetical protein